MPVEVMVMRIFQGGMLALSCVAISLAGIMQAAAQVKINEVMINDFGADDSCFVEIYGPPGTDLTAYELVGVRGQNGQEYHIIPLIGCEIPPDGFFVIGQSGNVPNADLVNPLVDYENGPDNLIIRIGGVSVDSVGYGDFAPPDTVFRGEGDPCVSPLPGTGLSRFPDGWDTNRNSLDFHRTSCITPGAPNQINATTPYYSLGEIRANQAQMIGELVWTSGIAISPAELFNGPAFIIAYLQDENAGICIYGGSFHFAVGDCLRVKAYVQQYNNLLELSSPQELQVGAQLDPPAAVRITCLTANTGGENLESMLVFLEQAWIVPGSNPWPNEGENANLTISDFSGADLQLRIDRDTDLDGWQDHPEIGEPFSLSAILNQYGSTYQVLPRSRSDFNPEPFVDPPLHPDVPAAFGLQSPCPNPFNSTTRITFSLTTRSLVSLRVYNLHGDLLSTLLVGDYPAGTYTLRWEAGNLTSGVYLLRLTSTMQAGTAKAVLIR
jgi:hypothetical protein